MSNKITCPQCGSTDTSYYDGAMGYEAVRCDDCNQETDLNNDHFASERTDNKPQEPTLNCTRLIIGEAVSRTEAKKLCQIFKEHAPGVSKSIGYHVLLEGTGNMVILSLEFANYHEAVFYQNTQYYRDLCTKTNHLLLGNYVHKVFENLEPPVMAVHA